MTTILFVCTRNAGRPQMAAAFCTHIEARVRALLASLDANR